jgi:hypothetical protein
MRLVGLPEQPPGPCVTWVRRCRPVVRATSRLPGPGAGRPERIPDVPPPTGFHPAPESDPAMPAPMNGAPLSRGSSPPQRNRSATSHHSRRYLLRVLLRPRRSCRPRRLAPAAVSPVSPPGALPGFLPPGPARAGDRAASQRPLPSCDWRPSAFAAGASLQGLDPAGRWGGRVGISPSRALPALLGFRLPGALPSAGLAPSLPRSACVPLAGCARRRPPVLLTCSSGQSRFRVGSLCS